MEPALLGGAGGICGMVVVFAGPGGGGGGVFFGERRGGREIGVVAAEEGVG